MRNKISIIILTGISTTVLAACGDDGGSRDAASASASASATATDTFGTDTATTGTTGQMSDSASSGSTGGSTTDASTTGTTDASSTGGSSTGGVASTGAGTTGGPTCGPEAFSFQFEPKTPNVMLVLDKSRSMSNLWDHDGDPNTPDVSRWNSLHAVVESFATAFEAEMNLGAQLFPSADAYLDEPVNAYSCLVEDMPEVPVGPLHADEIMLAIPAADDFSISGGTPATAGFTSALDHLLSQNPETPRAIVLITDGAANCSPNYPADQTLFVYDDQLPVVVGDAWATHAIPTYVVGINILDFEGTKPAVNPKEALTMVAEAGGVPKPGPEPFYNTFNEQELGDAILAIANKIPCTISLDSEPNYPDEVTVEVNNVFYDQVTDCENQDGWTYTNQNGPFNAIELCGTACDAFSNAGTVNIVYECP
ncbi:MAG: hypothetical protein D6705_16280 [Deltaproteobacteria bacterium]|nr:MAG: hypothetical protein D6705_16280 [Deltaproteobacteria bacterium]